MFELIESVRQKSDRTKKWIAFSVSFSFCAIIFAIWISVWYPSWRNGELAKKQNSESALAPLSSLKETFSNGFSEVYDHVSKLKGIFGGK